MAQQSENEAATRTRLIDVQLARAGWSKNRRAFVEEYALQAAAPESSYDGVQCHAQPLGEVTTNADITGRDYQNEARTKQIHDNSLLMFLPAAAIGL